MLGAFDRLGLHLLGSGGHCGQTDGAILERVGDLCGRRTGLLPGRLAGVLFHVFHPDRFWLVLKKAAPADWTQTTRVILNRR
jgi:hypothetical protein